MVAGKHWGHNCVCLEITCVNTQCQSTHFKTYWCKNTNIRYYWDIKETPHQNCIANSYYLKQEDMKKPTWKHVKAVCISIAFYSVILLVFFLISQILFMKLVSNRSSWFPQYPGPFPQVCNRLYIYIANNTPCLECNWRHFLIF